MEPEMIDPADAVPQDGNVSDEALAAFERGFTDANVDSTQQQADPDEKPAPKADKAPAAQAPAAPAAAAEGEPATEEDPYRDLPPAVRDALAKFVTVEAEVTTWKGRTAALQREVETLKRPAQAPAPAAAPAEPPAAPEPTIRNRVRGELPEVAEAMDELETRLREGRKADPKPAPEPAAAPAPSHAATSDEDREAAALAELDPDWAPKMNGTSFKLWLSTQPTEYQQEILSTSRALPVAAALRKFDKFQAGVEARNREASETEARRNRRSEGNAAPVRTGARGPSVTPKMTAEEAFEAGFKSTGL